MRRCHNGGGGGDTNKKDDNIQNEMQAVMSGKLDDDTTWIDMTKLGSDDPIELYDARRMSQMKKKKKKDGTLFQIFRLVKEFFKNLAVMMWQTFQRILSLMDMVTDVLIFIQLATQVTKEGNQSASADLLLASLMFISLLSPFCVSYSSGVSLFVQKSNAAIENTTSVTGNDSISPLGPGDIGLWQKHETQNKKYAYNYNTNKLK